MSATTPKDQLPAAERPVPTVIRPFAGHDSPSKGTKSVIVAGTSTYTFIKGATDQDDRIYIELSAADPAEKFAAEPAYNGYGLEVRERLANERKVSIYAKQGTSNKNVIRQLPMTFFRLTSPIAHTAVNRLPIESRTKVMAFLLPDGDYETYVQLLAHLDACVGWRRVKAHGIIYKAPLVKYENLKSASASLGITLLANDFDTKLKKITKLHPETGNWYIPKQEVVDIWTACPEGHPTRDLVTKLLAKAFLNAKDKKAANQRVKHLLCLEKELPKFWQEWDAEISKENSAREVAAKAAWERKKQESKSKA